MKAILSRSEAGNRIDEIHSQFRRSAFRVTRFLKDAERGFQMVRGQQIEIVERLSAAKTGTPLPHPPGAELVSIELKIEEIELLKTAMNHATAGMDHYPGMLSEMSLIYLVANFEAYLAGPSVHLVYRKTRNSQIFKEGHCC